MSEDIGDKDMKKWFEKMVDTHNALVEKGGIVLNDPSVPKSLKALVKIEIGNSLNLLWLFKKALEDLKNE